ncbi:hypothetical protein CGCF415_v011304 [Colletotrichum fructicola]|uniref:DUF7137 domain-containing protein n=1 Tax=Colletotrichum fructicola (strain Nara gc5) TaxID=1213859 RepID=L2GHU6_COLFN|nr:uncharacterized protein CGMCC3_g16189 [Colletotrichum fructicola]KAE9567675.1 hypothetical protein CGMCC3_g16189 [Colletotrichum fructicola]KAF4890974.1 hypothetical protein CGCFRS4_v008428 [Colletotrichum fructicola]KAF4897061.1 hypothetical protein CGCF415_v011304 [Colletotrichum fructicola]KAF4929303.1 hypothetical protein CGCF245_v012231 [Colletotrichum fructicola]KAF5514897.1 hypothetical protein CGCF413_v001240 [Colletotrichum fructicola]
MKAVHTLALGLAVFSPLASAWPQWLPDVDALVVRQNDESTAAATATQAASATTGAKATDTTADATNTGGAKTTNLNTAKVKTGTNTGSATGTGTDATASSESTFDARDPVGSVVMVDPATTANSINLYKIGDYVTWKWNYTNVQATPTAVDVLISCSSRSQTWTLTQNMSWAEPASYTWDTSVQATDASAPLGNDAYTLIIYDAESSVTATAGAGYLGVSNALTFGMYQPQAYTPLSDFNCPTCDSAASALNSKAISMAVGMSIITVASFTWFVAGLGMF